MNESNNNNNYVEYGFGRHENEENKSTNSGDEKIEIWNKSNEQKIDDDIYKDVLMPIERLISKQQQQQQQQKQSQPASKQTEIEQQQQQSGEPATGEFVS